MTETWKQYGKTVGRPDPKKEKGFTAVAHAYRTTTARQIAALPEVIAALDELYRWVENNVAYGTPGPLQKKVEAALEKVKP